MDTVEARGLIAQGEGQRIEFKRSFAVQNEGIVSLCAFIHADGGTVFFGVTDEGEILGVDIGRNTLEHFANTIHADTDPPLSPSVEVLDLDSREIVAATVQKASPGELFYAFGTPYVRVGKTNQVMAPPQQRARLRANEDRWAEERDRPSFEATQQGVTRLETGFQPTFKLQQVAGDYVANLEWRFRGPRFHMDWRQASGASLGRTTISATFDLTVSPSEDDVVGIDELGLEIRFHWRGRWRHEVHRWPLTRRELPTKVLWDVGREIIPPLYSEEDQALDDHGADRGSKEPTAVVSPHTVAIEILDAALESSFDAMMRATGTIVATGARALRRTVFDVEVALYTTKSVTLYRASLTIRNGEEVTVPLAGYGPEELEKNEIRTWNFKVPRRLVSSPFTFKVGVQTSAGDVDSKWWVHGVPKQQSVQDTQGVPNEEGG